MSFPRFLGMSCLVFFLVGPLVPWLAPGIKIALLTGDFSKLIDLVGAILVLGPWIYVYGGVFALQFGVIFSGLTWLLIRTAPRIFVRRRAVARFAFGLLLGVAIGVMYAAPQFVSGIVRRRQYPPYSDDLSLTLEAWWRNDVPALFILLILPSAVCAAMVSLWLVPKLVANPSINADAAQ